MTGLLHRALETVERAARRLRTRRAGAAFADLEMHLWMLADRVRADAYREAIEKTVRSGDVVVDVGAGTGLLSMMACQAGASRVYAIEETGVIALARRIVEANGMGDRIRLLEGRSSAVTLPEKADVVVSETIGSFVFSEGILPTLHDARRRLLREEGAMIPGRIRLYMTPVESFDEGIGFWERPVCGFDYAPARDHVAAGRPVAARKIAPGNHLAARELLYDLDFATGEREFPFRRKVAFSAGREGILHGFLATWEAELRPGVILACDPSAPPVHWPPLLFRLKHGIPVARGRRIILKFVRKDLPGWQWEWDAEVQGEQSDH